MTSSKPQPSRAAKQAADEGLDAERQWWLGELQRRYRARMQRAARIAPDIAPELAAATPEQLEALPELAPDIAPIGKPLEGLEDAAARLELATLNAARTAALAADVATNAARGHALNERIADLSARIGAIATQRDDEQMLAAAVAHLTF